MPTFIGSEEHKRLFCQTFTDTHRPFDPADIQWPDLDGESLERLRGLPIWDEAVETESETALKVQCLAKVEPDPVLAQAIALQGYEEGRHAAVLTLLTRRYGIAVKPFQSAGPPSDPLWAFLRAGYSECLESFFAFGLFAVGKRSGLFPDALIEIFDPILQEEARHILFIVNWAAYLRARAPLPMAVAFDVRRTLDDRRPDRGAPAPGRSRAADVRRIRRRGSRSRRARRSMISRAGPSSSSAFRKTTAASLRMTRGFCGRASSPAAFAGS